MTLLHTSVASLAFFQSTQLNLFERFLSQVVAVCEAAMHEYGMPARIRTDNGAPFAVTGCWGCRSCRLAGRRWASCTSGFNRAGRNRTDVTSVCIAL